MLFPARLPSRPVAQALTRRERQLPACLRCPSDDFGDFFEGVLENVVQDKLTRSGGVILSSTIISAIEMDSLTLSEVPNPAFAADWRQSPKIHSLYRFGQPLANIDLPLVLRGFEAVKADAVQRRPFPGQRNGNALSLLASERIPAHIGFLHCVLCIGDGSEQRYPNAIRAASSFRNSGSSLGCPMSLRLVGVTVSALSIRTRPRRATLQAYDDSDSSDVSGESLRMQAASTDISLLGLVIGVGSIGKPGF